MLSKDSPSRICSQPRNDRAYSRALTPAPRLGRLRSKEPRCQRCGAADCFRGAASLRSAREAALREGARVEDNGTGAAGER